MNNLELGKLTPAQPGTSSLEGLLPPVTAYLPPEEAPLTITPLSPEQKDVLAQAIVEGQKTQKLMKKADQAAAEMNQEETTTPSKSEEAKPSVLTPQQREKIAIATVSIIAGAGPGVADVLHAAQNPPPAIVQTYEGSYDFNTPYKVKVPATATPLSKEGQQGTEQPILSLPTASLTKGETNALAQAFPEATFPETKDPQFTNVFSTVSVDSTGRVTGLPFEKDSPADKLAQSYRTIIATANQSGGQPDVLVGRMKEKGTIAMVVRITNPITPEGGRTYKAGTFLYIDQMNTFGYLELTPRPGGEKDVLKLFAVDTAYQANVERFYIGPKDNPQHLKAPAPGEFTVVQVDEKGNAQVVVVPNLAITLFDTGDPSLPKATPQPGTSADLPTPLAPEVRAKVVEPAKGMEYWSARSQPELADIEKKTTFRWKEYPTYKDLSLNYIDFVYDAENKNFVNVTFFPILLEKPSVESIEINDIYTGQPKNIDAFTVPILLKTSGNQYVVMKVILGELSQPLYNHDFRPGGTMGGALSQTMKGMPIADVMAEMKPGEQYGMTFLRPVQPGKEKEYVENIKKRYESYKDQIPAKNRPIIEAQLTFVPDFAGLMAKYEKNVMGLTPVDPKYIGKDMHALPGTLRTKVVSPIGPVITVLFGHE